MFRSHWKTKVFYTIHEKNIFLNEKKKLNKKKLDSIPQTFRWEKYLNRDIGNTVSDGILKKCKSVFWYHFTLIYPLEQDQQSDI